MNYKAIIFDLDGTAIINDANALPSQKLIEIVEHAKKDFILAAATGRIWNNARKVIVPLQLEHPCVIDGGTKIIDPVTLDVLWTYALSPEQVGAIIDVFGDRASHAHLGDESESMAVDEARVKGCPIMYLQGVEHVVADDLKQKLSKIKDINVSFTPSYTAGCKDMHVTHQYATKKHALQELMKLLNLKKEEVIAVGDGNNDIPLLSAAGFKVAMGNADAELKAVADYVAPTVEDDGLAHVIKKYILKDNI